MKESTQQIRVDELSIGHVDRMRETVLQHHPMRKITPADKNPTPAERFTQSHRCPFMAKQTAI